MRCIAIHLISIHALREEGDQPRFQRLHDRPYFYPRPPRGGRLGIPEHLRGGRNFYPRPPRGGRPRCFFVFAQSFVISIHALREEGDLPHSLFVSKLVSISIHALREEGDGCGDRAVPTDWDFYPRPPRGGRLRTLNHFLWLFIFLSTPSARRATLIDCQFKFRLDISIHALREEGDRRTSAHWPRLY